MDAILSEYWPHCPLILTALHTEYWPRCILNSYYTAFSCRFNTALCLKQLFYSHPHTSSLFWHQ
jgi:hypothetical protein